jgi:hypothetical protein
MFSSKLRILLIVSLLVLLTSIAFTLPAMAVDGCDPEADLSGWLTDNGDGTISGTIVNASSDCSYDVGLASYYKFANPVNESIPNQELAFSQTAVIGPNSQLTLTVQVPECSSQVDLFYGDLIYSFTAENTLYLERIIVVRHIDTYPCDPGGADEGCTPGYWKNHDGFWSVKATAYIDIFFGDLGFVGGGDAALYASVQGAIGGISLDDALSVRGNRMKYEALLRASAAALLSAAHPEVDYPLSPSDVVSRVRTAWTAWLAGDFGTVESIKNELDGFNNLGCDLGRFPYP